MRAFRRVFWEIAREQWPSFVILLVIAIPLAVIAEVWMKDSNSGSVFGVATLAGGPVGAIIGALVVWLRHRRNPGIQPGVWVIADSIWSHEMRDREVIGTDELGGRVPFVPTDADITFEFDGDQR